MLSGLVLLLMTLLGLSLDAVTNDDTAEPDEREDDDMAQALHKTDDLTLDDSEIADSGTALAVSAVAATPPGDPDVPVIVDYDPAEEIFAIAYDGTTDPEPALALREDGADSIASLNGIDVLRVFGGAGNLSPEDFIVLDESEF